MTPLRMKMLDALMLRGMAVRTQEAYIDAVARLARHYGRGPERLSAQEVQQYLLHLLRERHLARSSVNQYGCAYRSLYGTVLGLEAGAFQIPLAPAPQRLPEILSREEIARLFPAACHHKSRTFLMVAYGTGLRLTFSGVTGTCGWRAGGEPGQRLFPPLANGKYRPKPVVPPAEFIASKRSLTTNRTRCESCQVAEPAATGARGRNPDLHRCQTCKSSPALRPERPAE
jgi:integrase